MPGNKYIPIRLVSKLGNMSPLNIASMKVGLHVKLKVYFILEDLIHIIILHNYIDAKWPSLQKGQVSVNVKFVDNISNVLKLKETSTLHQTCMNLKKISV